MGEGTKDEFAKYQNPMGDLVHECQELNDFGDLSVVMSNDF